MNEMVVQVDPKQALANAKLRYNLLVEFTKQVMKENKDFGIIPGTGTKPTLLKPGAEKLNSLFEYSPDYILVNSIIDFEKGFFYFQYRCDIFNNSGRKVGSGLGSCNSREKKYRYRNIPEKKATAEEKAAALRTETKKGQYGEYKVYVVENADPADLVNTLDKMAQKRALIAATLIACNASEFFTQDIEDYQTFPEEEVIEGEVKEVSPNPTPAEHDAAVSIKPDNGNTPTMALETALNVMTTEKEPRSYGSLTDDELNGRIIGIRKRIAKNNLTDAEREELQYKLSAAVTVMNARAKKS